jgi:hypothetical protein
MSFFMRIISDFQEFNYRAEKRKHHKVYNLILNLVLKTRDKPYTTKLTFIITNI